MSTTFDSPATALSPGAALLLRDTLREEGAAGMTHACGGCTTQEPCPSCGGNISRASSAYLAFEWGLLTTRSVRDPQWRTAAIARVLDQTPEEDRTPEWHALSGLVNLGQAIHRFATQGIGMALTPRPTDEDRRLLISTGDGPFIFKVPVVEPAGTPICCPILIYPVPVPEYQPDHVRAGNWYLHHMFEVLAIYKDEPQGPGRYCSCGCCVFRQYIDAHVRGTQNGQPLPDSDYRGEDFSKKDGSRYGRGLSPSCKNWGGKSCEDTVLPGGDQSMLSPKAAAALKQALRDHQITGSYCVYYMRDVPGIYLEPGQSKRRSDCFLGRVKDQCEHCAVKAEDSFSLFVKGSVDAKTWALTQQSAEGRAKNYKSDAQCNIPEGNVADC